MSNLIIFSNFRINDVERFTRMKDSFHSFKSINATKWIINVRGDYSKEVKKYLEDNLNDLVSVTEIQSGKGWFYDTKNLIKNINSDYLLYWTEDHISQISSDKYTNIIDNMKSMDIDYLFLSWFIYDRMMNTYHSIKKNEMEHISFFILNKDTAKVIKETNPEHYIISAQGLFKTSFFKKILNSKHPYLRRWHKETPFDLEKKITDIEFLPFKTAIPNYELFAPIDDDMGGYPCSLQTRGLYPKREIREITITTYINPKYIKLLKKITTEKQRYILEISFINPYFKILKFIKRFSYHL
jgi:hypothetical protein